jgi:AraC-like DNA-binding protein
MRVDEYAQARPSPAMRPYVAFYSGYRQRGIPPATHRGLPSPYLTLILTLDDPLTVAAHPDARQAPGRYDALIGGLHLAPALITHDGRQSGVQVAVHPLGCRALLGVPAGELAGTDADLAAVLGHRPARELRDRLHAAPTWAARFAALDTALRRLVRDGGGVHPDVAYAFDRLLGSGGRVGVAGLAAEIGWSARHLTNRFRAEVGLRPKEAARVVRFDRARRRLRPGRRMADVAADAGYFDQAHLAREFQAMAGVPASRWMAEESGFLQVAAAAGEIGFLQAAATGGEQDGGHG